MLKYTYQNYKLIRHISILFYPNVSIFVDFRIDILGFIYFVLAETRINKIEISIASAVNKQIAHVANLIKRKKK